MKVYRTLAIVGLGVAAVALTSIACTSSGTTTVKPATATPAGVPTAPAPLRPTPSSNSSSPNPSDAVLNAQFGQTYAVHLLDHYDYSSGAGNGTPVYIDYSVKASAPSKTYGPSPSSGYNLVFHVTVTATSANVAYNPLDFSVRNTSNETTLCGSTGEDTLTIGVLHAGQTASGTVICATGVTHGTFVHNPTQLYSHGSLVEWAF